MSLPPCPKTWIRLVLATVGVPPLTATAPPFTRILPAASRLITIELSAASPKTLSTPLLNDAVVAALACEVTPANAAVASRPPASSRRARVASRCCVLCSCLSLREQQAVDRPISLRLVALSRHPEAAGYSRRALGRGHHGMR